MLTLCHKKIAYGYYDAIKAAASVAYRLDLNLIKLVSTPPSRSTSAVREFNCL